jgi:mono/diheme cytochrome c family protein
MLKGVLLILGFIAMLGGSVVERGCRDARQSVTHLAYFAKRDMRSTVGFIPQQTWLKAPDSSSVPSTGKELWNPDPAMAVAERARLEKSFTNPQAADDSSVVRGARKFMRTCVPCHGASLRGDGPVAAKYIPPPDLLAAMTRGRTDGFIYAYIRHGGAVMPNYGALVTAHEAYDLINYLRHEQKTNPR